MSKKNEITVFTVAFNEYGRFVPQWIKYMKKQTVKPKMIVILGENHGADLKYLKNNNIEYYVSDSSNMGVLRNIGVSHVKTLWWLYFSVDDELLPHTCEEIINTDADAVSLIFDVYEIDNSVKKNRHSPCINDINSLQNWDKAWGGYVAIKGNTDLRFNEDVEVPNLTMHFELFRRGLKTVESNGVAAIHHRWDGSHHFRSVEEDRKRFIVEINKVKDEIIEELLEKSSHVKIEVLQDYTDSFIKNEQVDRTPIIRNGRKVSVLDGKMKKGDFYIVTKERGISISNSMFKNKPLAKIIDIVRTGDNYDKEEENN